MTNSAKYTKDSIKTLSARDFCRLRPGVYLGSNEYSTQLVKEIFANSLDEFLIGNGKLIAINVDTNKNWYSVEDHGQGFPINTPKGNSTVLQSAFGDFNTSGKYDDEKGIYKGSSLGCNGQGAKITNFLSKKLEVISYDGKQYEHLWFKDGIFEKRDTGIWQNGTTGTLVQWQPDAQFFQNVEANINELEKLFTDISALCPELTIELTYNGKKTIFKSTNGLQSLLNINKEILNNRFYIKHVKDSNLFDICMTYTSDYSENIIAYVNYGLTESGVHISTVRAGLTRQINRYAYDAGLLKKNADPLTQAELNEGLVLIFNVKANNVKYDSQVKQKVVDLDKTLINQVINNDFVDWLNNNPRDAKIIVEKALTARKAREAANKAKDNIRNTSLKGKKFISLPTKLVDAYSKKREETELFIVEGNSAMNGLVAKRDGKTQAIFPIRGKILNCLKASPDKIYANQEIANIVKALGLDIDKTTGKLNYDAKKLRYGHIFVASDADEDGAQIRLLLINMFWWLCPELITKGHLWAVVPPLFRITTKKNEYIYLKDKSALQQYNKKHKNEAYIVGRLKGLGEMSPDESKYCLLDPTTRNVQQIIVDNIEQTNTLFDIFMGTAVEPRRDYLLTHVNDIIEDI